MKRVIEHTCLGAAALAFEEDEDEDEEESEEEEEDDDWLAARADLVFDLRREV